jgi:hypothetical protein
MATRFEVARAIAYAAPAFESAMVRTGESTQAMLAKAESSQEKNFLLLASPEFMLR